MTLPRYFVSRPVSAEASARSSVALPPVHVVDQFRIAADGAAEQEWLVVSDALGRLSALRDVNRSDLPGSVQQELNCHEIGSTRPPRRIAASELFLFNLQLVEQPVPAPGLDDPVYLTGTLSGPFPAGVGSVSGTEGQLTVTRIDLLDALLQGALHAFRYPQNAAPGGEPARCFHLLLPGDREEALRGGRGLVLAYPLLPVELSLNDTGNEFIIRRLWYDLLSALRNDLQQERPGHPLCGRTLPVPSRHLLEQQLRADGYEIEGDVAVPGPAGGEGVRKIINSVWGALVDKSVTLPPEGTIADYASLTSEALTALPGFPPSRTMALRQRANPAQPGARFPVQNPVPPPVPASRPVPRPVGAAPPRLLPMGRREPADWMNDFIEHDRPEPTPTPKRPEVPRSAPVVQPPRGTKRQGQPGWMDDFAAPSEDPGPPAKAERPDWTNDFH